MTDYQEAFYNITENYRIPEDGVDLLVDQLNDFLAGPPEEEETV